MKINLIDRRRTPEAKGIITQQLPVYEKLVAGLGHSLWCFNLVLIEDSAMADLNGDFRDRFSVTDVLSFSDLLEQGTHPADLSQGTGGAGADLWLDDFTQVNVENDSIHIGEVILAPDFISDRCTNEAWSVESEFPMLVVHGALHLLGWDHQQTPEAVAMRNLEANILSVCSLEHPLKKQEGH